MSRVASAAVRYKAETFTPVEFLNDVLPETMANQGDFDYWMYANRAWIRSVMIRQCKIYDIGRDKKKMLSGRNRSEFYSMELEETVGYFNKTIVSWP